MNRQKKKRRPGTKHPLVALLAAVVVLCLCVGLVFTGIRYYTFVSDTIYTESIAHLSEIYHQANLALYNLVGRNWGALQLWEPYLYETESPEKIDAYLAKAQEENGFTDFYFISREGNYRTLAGQSGYLDLKDSLPDLILNRENVAVASVVPGQPEIIVFAIPTRPGTYRDFAYEAIAVSFNNSDLVRTLEVTAFDGQSACYIARPDGRMVVNNAGNLYPNVHNFLAMLQQRSSCTQEEINALQQSFLLQDSGAAALTIDNQDYYLVYEPAGFQDWVLLGIVPNDVLDMSRIEGGKIHLEEQEVNLSDVFHDIKTIISGQIHAKQLELYMDILDVTDEDVFCDKTRLNQVLLNLLSNAIKFTPPGGTVSVRVAQLLGAPEGKGLYEIRVKDSGPQSLPSGSLSPSSGSAAPPSAGFRAPAWALQKHHRHDGRHHSGLHPAGQGHGICRPADPAAAIGTPEHRENRPAGGAEGSGGGRRLQHLRQRHQNAASGGYALRMDPARQGGRPPGPAVSGNQ